MIIHQKHNSTGNFSYNAFVYNNTHWPLHFHNNFELVYAYKNSTKLSVGNNDIQLDEGELILIPPNIIHSIIPNNSTNWIAVFSEDFIHYFAKTNKNIAFSPFRCSDDIEAFLKKNLFYEGQPDLYMMKACLYLICGELTKNSVQGNYDLDFNFISQVTNYISENFLHNITMKETSIALGYEYHYFSALFHKNFAINFRQFLNLYKYKLSCEMLLENDNIYIVSDKCGFSNTRNFNRVFKNLSGKTPMEYKKEMQKNQKL